MLSTNNMFEQNKVYLLYVHVHGHVLCTSSTQTLHDLKFTSNLFIVEKEKDKMLRVLTKQFPLSLRQNAIILIKRTHFRLITNILKVFLPVFHLTRRLESTCEDKNY